MFNCQTKDGKQEKCEIMEAPAEPIEKPYSNPAIIFGSDFATFFQTLYRLGNYELMIDFTDSNCIKKIGRNKLLNYYKHCFKFDYSLGKLSNIAHEGDTILLSFTHACIYGTRRKVIIKCLNQRDSTKLIITNLSRNPFE